MAALTEPDDLVAGPFDAPDMYTLRRVANAGGEGSVFEAEVLVQGGAKKVALKVSRRGQNESDGAFTTRAASWREQLLLVQSLEHTSIVRMRETFVGLVPHRIGTQTTAQAVYLVMSWVEGDDLTTWTPGHPDRTFSQIKNIIVSVGSALTHLHAGGDTAGQTVCHRDVKPANVIVNGNRVFLVDFGLARGQSLGPAGGGTPGYLAPEVRDRGEYGPRSDLFGLAAVAFYLFTGTHPTSVDTTESLRAALRASKLVANLPGVAGVILAGLDADPSRRPSTVAEWVQSLSGTGSTTLPPAHAETIPMAAPAQPASGDTLIESASPRRRFRRILVATAVVAVALAAIAAGLYEATRSKDRDGAALSSSTSSTAADSTTTEAPTTSTPSTSSTTSSSTSTTTEPTATTVGRQPLHLEKTDPASQDGPVKTEPMTANGVFYDRAVTVEFCHPGAVRATEYTLGRLDGSTFTATMALADTNKSDAGARVTIKLDGRVVRDRTVVRFGEALPLRYDTSGVLRLRIEVDGINLATNYCAGDLTFGNPTVI